MYICILKRKTGHILLKTTFDVYILSALNNYRHTCTSVAFTSVGCRLFWGLRMVYLRGLASILKYPLLSKSPRGTAIFCFSFSRSQQVAREYLRPRTTVYGTFALPSYSTKHSLGVNLIKLYTCNLQV